MVHVIVAAALAVAPGNHATASTYTAREPGCRTRACDARVLHRRRRAAWARQHPWEHARNRLYAAHPGLKATLARLRGCETRGLPPWRAYPYDGHHDGAYQYDVRTWGETWAYVPRRLRRHTHAPAYAASPAEQDYRTGRFYPSHRGRWQCQA